MIKEQRQLSLLNNLETLGNISKTGYWEYDIVNNDLYWSEMTKEIHEVPKNYMPQLESAINFYLEGGSRETIEKAVEDAIESGLPFDVSVQILTYTGRAKWIRSIGHVKKEDGRVLNMYGSIQDIDESKGLEMELKSLTDRLEMAAKVANIGIFELNLKTNELLWDNQMYDVFGITKEDFTGNYEAWENSLHPKDKVRTMKELENAIAGGKDFYSNFIIIKPSGMEANIEAQAIIIKDENGIPLKVIGVNKDITAKTIIEKQLKKLYFQNQNQNKYLTNFAHSMTHNLRSSSGNLSMLIGLLKKNVKAEDKAMFLDMMELATIRLEETIAQLNETISIRFGEKTSTAKINIKDAIQKATENINALIGTKKAEVKITVPEALAVNGYQGYFESIFQNFLTNSLKYAREGIKPVINIEGKTKDDSVIIQISDNGMGIDLEKHGNSVFEMYKTFHGNKDAKGIGLFLTKEQVEAMGGTIHLESTPGEGTTFTLKFNK